MSLASKYFNYICLWKICLYILLIYLFFFITACLLVQFWRIFALTSTAYKFLEIGIAVGPISYVGMTIGDTRGNRIVLPHVYVDATRTLKKNGRISCDWCSRLLHYRYWFRNFKLNLSNYAMWTMWNYHYVISIYIWNDRALHTRTWTMCRTRTLWYANT